MLSAARPLARMFLDVQLPDEKVLAEVQRLVGNLVAMHELLRDASRVSMRLVMTPDRMVVGRGDAHVHLPEPVRVSDRRRGREPRLPRRARRRLLRRLARRPAGAARSGRERFAPVPVLQAPYFASEVIGAERLDELAEAIFADHDPPASCTTGSRRS